MEHSKQWTFYFKALLNFIEHSEQCKFYLKAMLNFIEHSDQWMIWSTNIVYIVSSLLYYFSLKKVGLLCMLIAYSSHVVTMCFCHEMSLQYSAIKRTQLCLLVFSRLLFSRNKTLTADNTGLVSQP